MSGVASKASAVGWGQALVLAMLMAGVSVAAPAGAPLELSQLGRPDATEAARILSEFRQSGILAEHYVEFELQSLPRRGESRVYRGHMWGGRNAQGAVNRIEVSDGEGRRHRLLVQSGANPAIWRLVDGVVRIMELASQFEPLIPGVDLTAFDLQRSYLLWSDATLQSTNRVLGRPAYAYLFRAPAGFVAGDSGIVAARAYFDTVFNQPLQSELLGADGRRLKTLSVVTLKTVDLVGPNQAERQTLPKEVDFRNELTRDKTRLRIMALTLDLVFPPGVFEPAGLASDLPAPSGDRLTRLAP